MLSAFYKDIGIPLPKPLNCDWYQVSPDGKCFQILIQSEHGMCSSTLLWFGNVTAVDIGLFRE